jgi:hypothetical protein
MSLQVPRFPWLSIWNTHLSSDHFAQLHWGVQDYLAWLAYSPMTYNESAGWANDLLGNALQPVSGVGGRRAGGRVGGRAGGQVQVLAACKISITCMTF